jgi:hypothetical protein
MGRSSFLHLKGSKLNNKFEINVAGQVFPIAKGTFL